MSNRQLDAIMEPLMDEVRRLKQASSSTKYGIASATTALSGLSPLPDLSSVNASASDVVAGKKFVDGQGTVVDGTLMNRGAVTQTLTPSSSTYTIPAGYHNGSGTVTAQKQAKSVSFTPNGSAQTINPDSGKFLSSVTIKACDMKRWTVSGEIDSSMIGSNQTVFSVYFPKSQVKSVDRFFLTMYSISPGVLNDKYTVFREEFSDSSLNSQTPMVYITPDGSDDLTTVDITGSLTQYDPICYLSITSESYGGAECWKFTFDFDTEDFYPNTQGSGLPFRCDLTYWETA